MKRSPTCRHLLFPLDRRSLHTGYCKGRINFQTVLVLYYNSQTKEATGLDCTTNLSGSLGVGKQAKNEVCDRLIREVSRGKTITRGERNECVLDLHPKTFAFEQPRSTYFKYMFTC